MIAELGHFSLILALICRPCPRFSSLGRVTALGSAAAGLTWLCSRPVILPTLFSARSLSAVWLGVSIQVTSPS